MPVAAAAKAQGIGLKKTDETQAVSKGNLCDIMPYVPGRAAGKRFQSLDAVSFWDVNFDGFTDIVTMATYGDTQYAVVYYGDMFRSEKEYWSFSSQEELATVYDAYDMGDYQYIKGRMTVEDVRKGLWEAVE